MSQLIVIIDYGMGNLHSVAKALEHVASVGDKVIVTSDPSIVETADRVVFPGQGAARDCMAAINSHQVYNAVLTAVAKKPFLGICMGLQVLLEYSEENAGTDLLGIFPGKVCFFGPRFDAANHQLKIPHMGWNQVQQITPHPLWSGIPNNTRFYFVHSYYVVPENTQLVIATTDYGTPFTSVLAHNNLFAVQFHPEKSADYGLRLLSNFLHWHP